MAGSQTLAAEFVAFCLQPDHRPCSAPSALVLAVLMLGSADVAAQSATPPDGDTQIDVFDLCASFGTSSRILRRVVGLSQTHESLFAGDWLETVKRRAVWRRRQRRVLSRRSCDHAYFVGGRQPDVLDQRTDRR